MFKTKLNTKFNQPRGGGGGLGLAVSIITISIALIIFANLVGVVSTSIDDSNLTGTNATLAGVVVLVFIAGVILAVLGGFFAGRLR